MTLVAPSCGGGLIRHMCKGLTNRKTGIFIDRNPHTIEGTCKNSNDYKTVMLYHRLHLSQV